MWTAFETEAPGPLLKMSLSIHGKVDGCTGNCGGMIFEGKDCGLLGNAVKTDVIV